jgi:hypothetical protein
MTLISKSAKLYQERRQPGMRETVRGPGPYIALDNNPVHSLKLEPPLPIPATQRPTNGSPPPDAGRTVVWPFGDEYVS